jgi:hypothetical protein
MNALVPQTIDDAERLARSMAGAKLVPPHLRESPQDCLLVINKAIRWQMDPFAVAEECSVIQGRIMYSGKLCAAVINTRADLEQRLSYEYDGEGSNRSVTVSAQIRGETKPRTVSVRLQDAKTQNKVWQTQPDQQLMYHGARVWGRRHVPELMLGVYSPEEFDEQQPLRASSKIPPKPAANILLPPHDPETGEIRPDLNLPQQLDTAAAANSAPVQSDGQPKPDTDQVVAGADLSSFGQLEAMAREAAERGRPEFNKFYKARSGAEKEHLNSMGDELAALMEAKT